MREWEPPAELGDAPVPTRYEATFEFDLTPAGVEWRDRVLAEARDAYLAPMLAGLAPGPEPPAWRWRRHRRWERARAFELSVRSSLAASRPW